MKFHLIHLNNLVHNDNYIKPSLEYEYLKFLSCLEGADKENLKFGPQIVICKFRNLIKPGTQSINCMYDKNNHIDGNSPSMIFFFFILSLS